MKYFPKIICLETKESQEMQGMLGNFKQSIKITYLKSQKEVAHIFFLEHLCMIPPMLWSVLCQFLIRFTVLYTEQTS